jgi:hypothetical protein
MKIFESIRQDILLIFFALTFCLFLLSYFSLLENLSLIFGILCFILTPGLYVVRILGRTNFDIIGYGLIFGLTIVIINVSLYSLLSLAVSESFLTALILLTVISIIILKIIAVKRHIPLDFSCIRGHLYQSLKTPQFYIFVFAIVFHYFFSFVNSTSMQPDAALYLDSSRTLVTNGIFSSHIIYDDTYSRMASSGLIDHTFITYVFSLFFQIHNISFSSALLSIVFVSALLVYPVFDLAKESFGKLAAILSALILTIHPLFVYYSSILFGPEICGLLFLLLSFVFIIKGAEQKSVVKLILAGIFLGISEEFWWANFYMILPFVPLLLVLFSNSGQKQIPNKRFILNLALSSFFIFLYGIALKLSSLYFLYIPIIVAEIVFFIFFFKTKRQSFVMPLSITLGLIITTVESVIKHYALPSPVASIVKNSIGTGLAPRALDAFTGFFKGSFLTGFMQYLSYLSNYGTLIILFMFVFAFLIFKNLRVKVFFGAIVIFVSILISLMPPPVYPQYLSSEGRYFLLPVSLMIIVVSSFLSKTIKAVLPGIFSATLQMTIKIGKKIVAIRLPSLIAIILMIAIIGAFFIPEYQSNIQLIAKENPVAKYGWTQNMLNWIQNHTNSSDVLMTSRARELAWFTNRLTVAVTTTPSMSSDSAFDSLVTLSQEFNATYIIADDYLYWNSPQLRDLCSAGNNQQGEIFLPRNNIISLLANGKNPNGIAYQLVFSQDSGSNFLHIWKITNSGNIVLKTSYQDLSSDAWCIGNGGQKSLDSNATKVVIGPGQPYTYTYSKNSLNLTLRQDSVSFFAWNVANINSAEVKRVEFWANGVNTVNIIPLSQIGVWTCSINTTKIDDLRVVVAGDSSGFIKINWLCVGTYFYQD